MPADAMQFPRDHQHRLDAAALAFMYGSVPWYVYIKKPAVMKDIVLPLPK